MELGIALLIYLGTLVGVTFFLLYLNYTIFASFVLALIFSLILLNILFPVTSNELDDINSLTSLYIFIQIFTLIIFFIYAFITTISETRDKKKFPMRYNIV